MDPSASLDRLSFLTGTDARVHVVETLRAGPTTKAELAADVDVSRTTLWRTLTALEERGLVELAGDDVALTVKGGFVADALTDLSATMRAIDRLDDLLEHLPVDEMDVDVGRLADAEIARPSAGDPMAPMRLATRRTETAASVRILSNALAPPVLDTMADRVTAGEQTVEMVLAPDVLVTMRDDDALRAQVNDLLDSDAVTVYRFDGEFPFLLGILDDEVGLGVVNEANHPVGTVRSEDAVVHEWAVGVYERFRDEARRVDRL